jgi:hypothetical protein
VIRAQAKRAVTGTGHVGSERVVSRNRKTALVLCSVVIAFFIGVIIRHWLWPSA